MMSGRVVSVDVVSAGVDVLEAAPVGAVEVVGVDAVDLDVSGGVLELPSGAVVDYVAVDYGSDVVTLADPLPESLGALERLLVRPVRSYTQAVVSLSNGGEVIPVRVPHTMQSSLPVGVREGDPELVDVEVRDDGSFWIHDVHDRPPLEVWGDPEGSAAEMSDDGLSFYTLGPNGRYEATRLGSGQDRLGVFNAAGQTVGGVTADGQVVGQSGVIAGDFSVGGVPLMGRLWDNSPGAPTGWLERFSAGAVAERIFNEEKPPGDYYPTDEVWGYAKLGVTARAGRTYRVMCIAETTAKAAVGLTRLRLHHTTNGTEPTVSSPQIAETTTHTPAAATYRQTHVLVGSQSFDDDTDWRIMVSAEGRVGLEPHWSGAYFIIEDLGPQGTYGGGTYTTGRETTPPPTVREYTSTWTATDFRVYDETTQPVAGAPQPAQFGFVGGAHVYTAILFDGPAVSGSHAGDTINDTRAGATITKAEVFLANTSNGGRDAGRIALGKGAFTALPPTLAPQATVQPSTPTGGGTWTEVPVHWFDGNLVVTLGDVAGGIEASWFMGPGDEFPPQVRLTYTK